MKAFLRSVPSADNLFLTEGCQSGRMGWFRKPLRGNSPGVQIPLLPPELRSGLAGFFCEGHFGGYQVFINRSYDALVCTVTSVPIFSHHNQASIFQR